jgi:hypothetical protein
MGASFRKLSGERSGAGTGDGTGGGDGGAGLDSEIGTVPGWQTEKKKGDSLYHQHKYREAVHSYMAALDALDPLLLQRKTKDRDEGHSKKEESGAGAAKAPRIEPEHSDQAGGAGGGVESLGVVAAKLHGNLSAAYFMLCKYRDVIVHCEEALKPISDARDGESSYYKGQVHHRFVSDSCKLCS